MTLPATRLPRAPLVHVLAQVVFPAPPAWMDAIPQLQRELYALGYLRMHEHTVVEVSVDLGDGSTPPVQKQRLLMRYEFADRDQRTAFVLTASSFVMHTTDYQTFDRFLAEFVRGLDVLHAATGVPVVDRIGLRYVDLIQLQASESFGFYVHPGLLGYPFRANAGLGGTKVGFATGSVAETPLGALAVRSTVVPPGQFAPPDLELGNLQPPTWVELDKPGLALDFDHFTLFGAPHTAAKMDFDAGRIAAHLTGLHTNVRAAFEGIVTEDAVAYWGGWQAVTP